MIHTQNLSLGFDRPVLHDVCLNVPAGCLYGLIGPGAAGKSVLLKALAGLVRAQVGEIVVDGTSVTGAHESELFGLRQRIGMLFQNNALFDFMTVGQNVGFPLRQLRGASEAEVQDEVSGRLTAVGIPGFEARYPSGLSGGQKKRVGVARATITGANILLYDEPTAGLDPVSSQKLFELLRKEQRERSCTVVMVSSDLQRLLSVTDQVGMMLAGRLIFEGPTARALDSDDPRVHQFVHGLTDGPL